jgi:hypothetical protein
VREDGEQDTIHAGLVLEGAHGPGPSPDFAEAAFNGGSYLATLRLGFVAEAGEQFVEVVSQACNGIGIALLEVAGGRSRCTLVGGIHDLLECALDIGQVGLADSVEGVPASSSVASHKKICLQDVGRVS